MGARFIMPSIQPITHSLFEDHHVSVWVKRDDQVHPVISGNKWYKLKYHLEAFHEGDYSCLATFGGAYSNHLHALAYACHQESIPSLGFVRGEHILPLNPTLQDCVNWGMILIPLSRKEYALKQDSKTVREHLEYFGRTYCVPEGGSGLLGVKGSMEIISPEQALEFDHIVVAAGTGTTAAGIIANASASTTVHVIAVLKAKQWLQDEIQHYLDELNVQRKPWLVHDDYTFGGYAKRPERLLDFIDSEKQYVPLEPIYTGKAWYALHHMIRAGRIGSHERVLFIHTGGLQGWR